MIIGIELTQLRLKQSCEQKKLSLRPSFRQVGHWRAPASFSQSTPRHFFFAGGSEAMMDVRRATGSHWWKEKCAVADCRCTEKEYGMGVAVVESPAKETILSVACQPRGGSIYFEVRATNCPASAGEQYQVCDKGISLVPCALPRMRMNFLLYNGSCSCDRNACEWTYSVKLSPIWLQVPSSFQNTVSSVQPCHASFGCWRLHIALLAFTPPAQVGEEQLKTARSAA